MNLVASSTSASQEEHAPETEGPEFVPLQRASRLISSQLARDEQSIVLGDRLAPPGQSPPRLFLGGDTRTTTTQGGGREGAGRREEGKHADRGQVVRSGVIAVGSDELRTPPTRRGLTLERGGTS